MPPGFIASLQPAGIVSGNLVVMASTVGGLKERDATIPDAAARAITASAASARFQGRRFAEKAAALADVSPEGDESVSSANARSVAD